MSKWTIYDRYGVAKLEASNLEYHDSWMGEEFVNVSISSATPINLEIGDFLTYRGLTYTIYSLPTALKQARSGSTGDAFKYDNVKFSARSTELTEIRFFDIVLNDNELHYTSLPTFSFYAETVDDFLDRIQANTDRDGGHQWIIVSPNYTRTIGRYPSGSPARAAAQLLWEETFGTNHSTPSNADLSKVKNNVNISIDKQSIFDSLQHIKNSFGLNFITKERTIVVGGEGIAAGHLFQYGKGKGLYQIERSADADQQVVTKLYAYGSDKNIPTRYYADLGKTCYVNSNSPITTRISSDVQVWIEADIVQDRYYTKVSTFDPELKLVKLSCDGITVQGYLYNEKIQVYYNPNYYHDYHERSYENAVAFANAINGKTRCAIVDGINTEIWPADHVDYSTAFQPDNMAVNVLMLPGYPKESLYNLCRYRIIDSSTPGSKKTIYEIRKTVTSPYQTLMEVEGEFPIAFSTERLRPYLYSQNVSTLGVKEGDIHFVEENDDNGLKEVYPSVEGMTEDDVFNNGSSARLDVIAACESITDDGRYRTDDPDYKFPNFHITIPNLGFDLKQTAEDSGGDVTISLTDGYCGGRDFKVVDITQNNDLTWDLECERCPDDTLSLMFPYSDAASHGQTPSANEPYQIRTGDHYVLSGINIKETSYIWGASVEALRKAITWLLNNDFTRFTYLPRVDEIYMKRQDDLAQASQGAVASMHDTLKAGHLMLFQDTDLDVDGSVFIDSLTIKEDGNNGIPTYDVVLRNDKQVGTMQRVQNQLNSLTSFVAGGGGGYNAQQIRSLIKAYGAELFLSKLTDDTAQGFIHLLQGLQVGEQFVTGLLGEGGVFRMDDDGKTYIEADKMYVRMKAYFDSVEIREYKYTGGNRIASVAGNKAVRVEWIKIVDGQETILDQTTASPSSADFFRCYFRASDGEDTVRNNFVVGDMVYCHVTSIAGGSDDPEQKGLNQKHYWRLCIGRNVEGTLTDDGEAWIDISNRSTETIDNVSYAGYQSGSDYPDAQDSMIQLGNVNDNTRQGAIIEFVTGADAPSYQIYQGIGTDSSNIYSLNNKNQVAFGYNSQTGRAYLNAYGDFRFGSRTSNGSYISYNQQTGELLIKAHVEFTNSDAELNQLVQSHQITYGTEIDALVSKTDDLQEQIDGAIETYYMNGVPSLQVPPVVSTQEHPYDKPWLDGTETPEERTRILNNHVGDLYYDKSTGHGYRFLYDDDHNTFAWVVLTDEDVTEALRIANEAQETADGKRRIFVSQPAPISPNNYVEYDIGDLWVNATYPASGTPKTYENDVLRCKVAKPIRDAQGIVTDGSFSISDWELASKYTDDTYAHGFDYISSNLARLSSTQIAGGLVLSSLIGLRDSNQNIQSGISGIIDSTQGGKKGGGIAAWFGGEQGDKEDQNNYSGITRWAKSILRFDGSGYLANGNITWDATGKVTIKDLHTDDGNLSVDVLQEMTSFRSMFDLSLWQSTSRISPLQNFDKVKITHSNGYTFTDNDVLNRVENDARYMVAEKFFDLFDIYDGSNNYTNTYKTSGLPSDTSNISIKAKFGLWTDSFLSALGLNPNSGGGGGGIDMTQVWSALAASTTEQINVTHLGTALSNFSTKAETIQDIQNNGHSYLVTRANGTTFNIDAACAIDISDYFSGGYMSIGDGYIYYYNGTPLEIRKYSETTSTTITYLVFAEQRGDYNPNSHYASSFPYPYEVHVFSCIGTTMCEYVNTYSWSDASSIIKQLWGDGLYLPLSGGTMGSTTLVTNLNADLLDGHHASEFLLLTGGTITGTLAVNNDVTIGGIGRTGNYGHLDVYDGISSKTREEDFDTGDMYTIEVYIDPNAIDFKYGSTSNRLNVSRTGTNNGRLLYSNNVLAYKTEIPASLDAVPDGTYRKLSDYMCKIYTYVLPSVSDAQLNALYIVPSASPSSSNSFDEWIVASATQVYVNGSWHDVKYKGTAMGWYPNDYPYVRDTATIDDVLLHSDLPSADAIEVCEVPYDETTGTPAVWGGYDVPIGTAYSIGNYTYVYVGTTWDDINSPTCDYRSVRKWEKVGGSGSVSKIVVGSTTYNAVGNTITLPAYLPLTGGTMSGTVRFGTAYSQKQLEISGGVLSFSNDNFATMPFEIHVNHTTNRFETGGSASGYTFAYTSDIPDLTGYATQTWVQNQGYLTSSAISDMATQTWVGQQGYVTSSALNGYATQSWVQQQGYLTSLPSHNHDGRYYINNGTIYLGDSSITPITSLSGYATQSWVQQQGYITSYTNTARMQVSDTTNKRINTQESTGNYIQFSGGTNKFTVSDGTNSFDVSITPSVTFPVTSVVGQTGAVTTAQIASALTSAGYKLTDTVYSLPLAANGTRGGVQIGYAQNGQNYPVQLSGEKMYVNVPWTDHTYDLSNYIRKGSDTLSGNWLLSYPNSDTLDGHYIGGSHIDVFNLVNEEYDDAFTVRLDIMRPQNEASSDPDFFCRVRLPQTEVEDYLNVSGSIDAGGYIDARGGFWGSGFHKDNSNDNYVLLGGGGHALISGLSVAYAASAGSATDSTKLPLSGGTLTNNSTDVVLSMASNNTTVWMGWKPSDSTFRYLGVDTSNNLKFQYNSVSYNVIHSGNIGSQSVSYATSAGDADTLDGYHYNGLPYIPKMTYEYNFESNFGRSGLLLIGRFACYDSNVTIYIDSATSRPMHATLVLATQNINDSGGGSISFKSYGDYENAITPNVYLYYPSNSRYIEIYYVPASWSKNCIHIKACGLLGAEDINTQISSLPDHTYIHPSVSHINCAVCVDDYGYFVGSSSYGFRFNSSDDAYNNFIIYDNGNTYTRGSVGIGTTPSYKLDVNGTGHVSGKSYIGNDLLSTRTSNFHIGFETNQGGFDGTEPYLYLDYEDHVAVMSCGYSVNHQVGFDSDGWLYEYFGDVFRLYDDANDKMVIEYNSGNSYALELNANTKVEGSLQVGRSDHRKTVTVFGSLSSAYPISDYDGYSVFVSSSSTSSYISFAKNGGGGTITFKTYTGGLELEYYVYGNGSRHHFGQNVYIDGSCDATSHPTHSDARLKNIYDYNALVSVNTIAMAPAVRFTWKDGVDKDLHCGTLAQYWQAVMPECVISNNDGYLSMQYDVISLLAAISIAKKVQNHEERIVELEKENERLRMELEQMRLNLS